MERLNNISGTRRCRPVARVLLWLEEVELPEVRLNDLSSLPTTVGAEIVGNDVRYQVLHVRPLQGFWEAFRDELSVTRKRVVL